MTGPPRNANAPLAKGRRDKLTGGTEYDACSHSATLIQRLPEGEFHYGAQRCAACGAFVDWVAKPENIARRRLIAAYVARLLTVKGLASWEATFLHSVSQRKKLSPRQRAVLDRLVTQYLEGAP